MSLVNDKYFCTSGAESEQKMQEIMNYYAATYEDTRGKVQKEKVMMNSWKWKIIL